MENKVSGSRAVCLTLAAALALPAHAGGGASGGATEVTQLLNHIELVMQVGEATQTTANTLQTAQATMQMLRQLSPDAIAQMTGVPIDQVEKMAEAYVVMSQATQVYNDAAGVLAKAQRDAERLNISPSELLRYKAEAAYKHGGIYQQTYEQEQAKLRRLAEVSKDVQKQAEQVKSIDANVKGIQFLASQNIAMQSSLLKIADSIATANSDAARAAKRKEDAEGDMSKMLEEKAKLKAEQKKQVKEGFSNAKSGDLTNIQMFNK